MVNGLRGTAHLFAFTYTTHLPQLTSHNSSHTTHVTQLISHNSSYTTHLTQLISHNSSHTTHLPQLHLHYFTYTTHLPQLTSHNSSYTTPLAVLLASWYLFLCCACTRLFPSCLVCAKLPPSSADAAVCFQAVWFVQSYLRDQQMRRDLGSGCCMLQTF